jgi:hypothetical protein
MFEDSTLVIDNSILWGNTASAGPQLAIAGWQNTVSARYSILQGGAGAVYQPFNGFACAQRRAPSPGDVWTRPSAR